jgi:hypothetical protein
VGSRAAAGREGGAGVGCDGVPRTVSAEAAAYGALSGVVAVAMAGSRTAVGNERSDVDLYVCYYTQLNVLSFKVFAL